MKRQWDATELVEHFTLIPEEVALLENKSEENRLGFAVLLKFFQMEAKFPRTRQEVPKLVVAYIASLLGLSPRLYKQYEWEGRTFERHRAEIREFFGFREFTVLDGEELKAWLCEKVLTYERQQSHLESASYKRLRELKLEPPTPERLERLIRSAVTTTEKKFCTNILGQLSLFSLRKMDALLDTKDGFDDDESHFRQSVFNFLKSDPGRTSLQSIFKEISKLQCIRDLQLPLNLFDLVPPKIVNHYRRRASAETPRELRRHPVSIRYTLVAAFCWQRSQEITDSLVELLVQIIHGINARAERRVDKELLEEFKRVDNKPRLLFEIANASAEVVNATLAVRKKSIWGEGTTACASDSKKFGSWDQNLMTEWHIRYGGRGVMIYWHVEKKSACIYSQLKTCSSSEVGAMIQGLLHHCTDMEVKKNYVDTHGQNEIAYAFCRLLGFDLMPRIKRIGDKKLSLPFADQKQDYPNLQPILKSAIDWELIRQQYDQMIKYATALRLGTTEADNILKRFSRSTVQHPTHKALNELGKAVKTIFLCHYLHSEALRREIHEGLNVVEQWNGANTFIFYGKNSEIATNRLDEQELSVLCLHLLQMCLVYINTLMIQKVLADPVWMKRMTHEDLRALTPLIWKHVNPYGTFHLNMNERLELDAA
ncbi:hypothetical protein CAL7716_105990 (plasmid) [Calothrix sp. PCC 7716]|nr:hypothetical protein CAL7716_104260 [Calothrix sp. PCC 7716]BDA76357.1 hypothetical protein CAL7716_105230 [Calothrix sp. PCC 7716]BDA76433.1 hypothetical protein CAL7716_105990 [Calothrix sp. PCC 7716]